MFPNLLCHAGGSGAQPTVVSDPWAPCMRKMSLGQEDAIPGDYEHWVS